jgi:hypothetical protein
METAVEGFRKGYGTKGTGIRLTIEESLHLIFNRRDAILN